MENLSLKIDRKYLINNRVVILLFSLAYTIVLCAHFNLFFIFPAPFFQPDSGGYFHPAVSLVYRFQFSLSEIRTPGYPLFLYLILTFTKSFFGVIIIQVVLLFLTGIIAGILFFFIHRSLWIAVLIAVITPVLPRPMMYAHTIMSDNLFAFFFLLSILTFLFAVRKGWKWFAWTGIFCFLSILVRPSGYALGSALLLSFVWTPIQRRMLSVFIFIVTLLIPLLAWAMINYSFRGSFSLTGQSGEVLFSSSGYLLNLDAQEISDDIRETLLPIYEKNRAVIRHDHAWTLGNQDGPVINLKKTKIYQAQGDQLFKNLAILAIRQKPILFVKGRFEDLWGYLTYASRRPTNLLPKDIFWFRGIQIFWKETTDIPEARTMLRIHPEKLGRDLARIKTTTVYPYEYGDIISTLLWPLVLTGAWLPLAGFLSSLMLMFNSRARPIALTLIAVEFLHLLMSSMGGGVDGRYALTVEPIYLILFFAGTMKVVGLLKDRFI
ncbi:MAG: hypothetical protein KCHDKBKB_01820 [Elusimicrobia bacterium]|nr:hypothetical protein [Elusimicrobiota bacterium]